MATDGTRTRPGKRRAGGSGAALEGGVSREREARPRSAAIRRTQDRFRDLLAVDKRIRSSVNEVWRLEMKAKVLDLMLERKPRWLIAVELGVHESTVFEWEKEVREEVQASVKDFDARSEIGLLLERTHRRRERARKAAERLDADDPRLPALLREEATNEELAWRVAERFGLLPPEGTSAQMADFEAYADWSDDRLATEMAFRVRQVWLRLDPGGAKEALRGLPEAPRGADGTETKRPKKKAKKKAKPKGEPEAR